MEKDDQVLKVSVVNALKIGIDELLDEYNDMLVLYKLFNDKKYLRFAKNVITEELIRLSQALEDATDKNEEG